MATQDRLVLQDISHDLTWQQQLAQVTHSAAELLAILQLSPDYLPAAIEGAQAFALRVPYAYLKRIKPGDINDPLLRQIWPFHAENQAPPEGYVLDPLGENQSNTTPGIVHKYQGRVLLITNGSCAIHCRYCFRRHFPYQANALSRQQWANALAYVQKDDSIQEVILSGGDPLTSSDVRLFHLIDAIEAIPHVTRLRIHTRLPIVIPARITDALLDRLSTSRLNIVMVVHANHANEIDDEVGETLKRIFRSGIHLLNQSVLLKGVNDSEQALIDLSEKLFQYHALPYYLHLLDKVVGAHHFDVNEDTARQLVTKIQLKLPGFLLPKLVREVAGCGSKTLISLDS